jgi:hypothetical protein
MAEFRSKAKRKNEIPMQQMCGEMLDRSADVAQRLPNAAREVSGKCCQLIDRLSNSASGSGPAGSLIGCGAADTRRAEGASGAGLSARLLPLSPVIQLLDLRKSPDNA